MSPSAPAHALSPIVDVRWRLLESFALARQEGLAEPVGLVIDTSHAYGLAMSERLLLSGAASSTGASRRATCLERAVVMSALHDAAPDVVQALRQFREEPGQFTAVLLAERGLVLTGTWQELITGEVPRKRAWPSRTG